MSDVAPLLELSALSKSFGGNRAISDLSFSMTSGEIVAVIGPNGAGKTTLFNMISGVFPPTTGKISYRGREITGLNAYSVAALGIARTFQMLQLFSNMSVIENVMVGRHLKSRAGMLANGLRLPFSRTEEREIYAAAMEQLTLVNLDGEAHNSPLNLPYGNQKRLEIARALAIEPDLLLLDEPAGGLASHEIEALAQLILKIREMGITIILIEHRMELVMGIADKVVVINYGEKIGEGTPAEMQADERVVSCYLGDEC